MSVYALYLELTISTKMTMTDNMVYVPKAKSETKCL